MEERKVLVDHFPDWHEAIAMEAAQLHALAMAHADNFWEENRARRSLAVGEQGKLGCRIRQDPRSKWFRIVWYKNEWAGAKGKRRPRSRDLIKGNGYRYHDNLFSGVSKWERELAIATEREFAHIRRMIERLKSIARDMQQYEADQKRAGLL